MRANSKIIVSRKQRLAEIRKLIGMVQSTHDAGRVVALCLKVLASLTAKETAYLLRMKPQTVNNLSSAYKNKRLDTIVGKDGRGGRRRCNLSLAGELMLLREACVYDGVYGRYAVSVDKLRSNYPSTSKRFPLNCTLYRLLRRHGCRRIEKGLYTPPAP